MSLSNNKTFLRILRKSLGFNSREELVTQIEEFQRKLAGLEISDQAKSFFDDFVEFFDSIDKSFNDLDRTLYLRDSSLAVSSREMTALNEEIQSEARRQAAILARLQATVRLLTQSENVVAATSDEVQMEKLVEMVDFLVRTKVDAAKLQKTLYGEGLKICSVLSFRNLEVQLRSSTSLLAGSDLNFEIFFSGSLFDGKDAIEFYRCDDRSLPIEDQKLSTLSSNNAYRYLNIDSPKGNGILAVMQFDTRHLPIDEADHRLSQISPLIPSVASTLENIRLLQEEKRKQFMESELDTIRLVQQTLLPTTRPLIESGDIEISGYYQSATECSGDWWTYFQLKDRRHVILVGDVTGHGTGSAMVCAVIKGYCDSYIDRADLSMNQLLEELNTVVWRMAKDGGRAMTMAAICIDTNLKKATYSNAGHPFPILVSGFGTDAVSSHIMNTGSILGLQKESKYKEISFNFEPGDRLLLYSDGLTESTNSEDLMYGENRLRRLMKNLDGHKSAAELNRMVIQDVVKFSIGETFKDDLTTVVVRYVLNNQHKNKEAST